MRNARLFLFALLLAVAGVIGGYFWLDQPISYFAHAQLAQYRIFKDMQRAPEIMAVLACLVFTLVGYFVLVGRPVGKLLSVLLLSGTNLAVSALVKDQLKFVFGRTWPDTWINNNPSLIRDGVSNFNFFHGGAGYGSFPSGHTTLTCAAMLVFWIAYPRFRIFYAAIITAVVVGLIGANYHFLSDIIAGAFIGGAIGWIAVLLWEAGNLPRIVSKPSKSTHSA